MTAMSNSFVFFKKGTVDHDMTRIFKDYTLVSHTT